MVQTVSGSATLVNGTDEYDVAPTISTGLPYYDMLSGSDVAWYKFAGTSGRTAAVTVTYNYSPGLSVEFYADPGGEPVLTGLTADSSAAAEGSDDAGSEQTKQEDQ